MKWWFFVWVIGVALMTASMSWRSDPVTAYCAARRLPRNHRIVPADLKPFPASGSPIVGKYVRARAIEAGDRVRPYELTTYPEMRVAEGRTPCFVPLKAEWNLQDALNAGSVVDIWDGPEQIAWRTRVLAVLTERTGTTVNYVAVLETGAAEAKRLTDKTKDLRILIRDFESGGENGN